MNSLLQRYPVLAWVAPFAVFMALLVAAPLLPFGQPWESIIRVTVLVVVLVYVTANFAVDIINSLLDPRIARSLKLRGGA